MSCETTISIGVKCPRCGYDLRGTVATWKESCPLAGICTECGLTFLWAEVLSAKVRKPRWCVEYAERWWHIPWRSLKTLGMTFCPWGFWKSLKMSHEARWGRLLSFALVLLALVYLSFAVVQGIAVSRAMAPAVSTSERVFSTAYAVLLPLSFDPPSWYGVATRWGPPRALPSPLWFTARHFQRGPDSDQFHHVLLTGYVHRSGLTASFWTSMGFLVTSSFAFLCIPMAFVLLPISRRQADVRWSHIVRITAYSLVLFFCLLVYALLRFGFLRDGWWVSTAPLYRELRHVVLWVTPLLLLIWWSFAISRYLKMPHAWAVGLAIVVVGVLVAAGLTVLMILLMI